MSILQLHPSKNLCKAQSNFRSQGEHLPFYPCYADTMVDEGLVDFLDVIAKADEVLLTIRNLSGEVVWGPELLQTSLSAEDLRSMVADALDLSFHRVHLAHLAKSSKCSQLIDGQKSLKALGFSGDVQLQLILEDPTEIIREIQAHIRCDQIDPGLTTEELKEVEQKYGFAFPPDVRDFLQVGLPLGCGWHDWRHMIKVTESEQDTVSQIQTLHCIPWRVRYSKDRQWDENESLAKAQDLASRVYPMIPLCQHRCIPSVPHECGLPILSMHGCYDNLCHSRNLWTWLEEMMEEDAPAVIPQRWKDKTVPVYEVPFWQHWYDI